MVAFDHGIYKRKECRESRERGQLLKHRVPVFVQPRVIDELLMSY